LLEIRGRTHEIKGSAIGGATHPIMLNAWFHGSLGFHSGVKASGALNGGLLLIALVLMQPRYPLNRKKADSTFSNFRGFLHETPYVIMIFGQVILSDKRVSTF